MRGRAWNILWCVIDNYSYVFDLVHIFKDKHFVRLNEFLFIEWSLQLEGVLTLGLGLLGHKSGEFKSQSALWSLNLFFDSLDEVLSFISSFFVSKVLLQDGDNLLLPIWVFFGNKNSASFDWLLFLWLLLLSLLALLLST
jgi:hypothetical protein